MSRFFAGTETDSVLLRCHCGHRSRECERYGGNAASGLFAMTALVVAEFVLALAVGSWPGAVRCKLSTDIRTHVHLGFDIGFDITTMT